MPANPRSYWLLKTEPAVFSFEDLVHSPQKTTSWEGVRNYQARNFLRDLIRPGDGVLIYHSNAEPMGVYGAGEVVRGGYPDLTALDPRSRYFDEDSKKKGESPWYQVDIRATHRMKSPVTREVLRNDPRVSGMMVLQKGSRLSVQPVTEAEFCAVLELGTASMV